MCYRHAHGAIDNEKQGTKFDKLKQKGDPLLAREILIQPRHEKFTSEKGGYLEREYQFLCVLGFKGTKHHCVLSKQANAHVFLLSLDYDLCRCVAIAERGLTGSNEHAKHVEPHCAMPARCQLDEIMNNVN